MANATISDADLALGGYRYQDLLGLRIVSSRSDLNRKQREHGFPLPYKGGNSQAIFLKVEVHAWIRSRLALRNAPPLPDPFLRKPPPPHKPPRGTRRAIKAKEKFTAADKMRPAKPAASP